MDATSVAMDDNRKSPNSPTPSENGSSAATQATMTLVRRMATVGLSIYMMTYWVSSDKTALFQYHPLTMTAAFLSAMPEAVVTASWMKRSRTMGDRIRLSRWHLGLSVSMSVLALVGYVVIYINKSQRKKQHLATWHGLIGFVTVVATLVQLAAGAVVYFRLTSNGNVLAALRKLHRFVGPLVLALGALSMWLGMQSNFAVGAVVSVPMRAGFGIITLFAAAAAYLLE